MCGFSIGEARIFLWDQVIGARGNAVCQRKFDPEASPGPFRAESPDFCIVSGADRLDNRKSQACASGIQAARLVPAVKAVENVGQRLRGYSNSAV
jgi:hypothetical protein